MESIIIWKTMITFILVIGTLYKNNDYKELLELKYK